MVKYMKRFERIGKDFEIQFYDSKGDNKVVIALKTAEDLAQYLSAEFWSCCQFTSDFQNPTIYYNGKRFGSFELIEEVEDINEIPCVLPSKHSERNKEIEDVVNQLEALFKAIKYPTTSVLIAHGWEGEDEYIYVHVNDATYRICITADSKAAIVKDVVDKVIYKF